MLSRKPTLPLFSVHTLQMQTTPPPLVAHFLLKTSSSPGLVIALITSTPAGHPCNPLECGPLSICHFLGYIGHMPHPFGFLWAQSEPVFNAEECCHCSRKPRSDNYHPSQYLTNPICGSAEDNYPSLFVTGVGTANGKATPLSFAIVKALLLRY